MDSIHFLFEFINNLNLPLINDNYAKRHLRHFKIQSQLAKFIGYYSPLNTIIKNEVRY